MSKNIHHKKLSRIIPTKNRSAYLGKVLQHHAQTGFQGAILVGDASDIPFEMERNQQFVKAFGKVLNITYFKQPPSASILTATNLLFAKVSTPYSLWSGDDDFFVPAELERSIAFLETHSEYSCACGQQAYVTASRMPDGHFKVERAVAGYSKSLEEELPSQRMVQYCMPARANNTFSVQRTEIIRYAHRKALELGLDKTKYHNPLHEVAVNVFSLIQGKQFQFPNLYHVMLRHSERAGGGRGSFQGNITWLQRMCRWNWSDEIPQLIDFWAQSLSQAESLSYESAAQIAEAVFMQCFLPVMEVWRDDLLEANGRSPVYPKKSKEYVLRWLRQKGWARKMWEKIRAGQKLSLPEFLNKRSPYYKDFEPIHKVLSESL